MDIAAGISRLFRMDEATWARHAHPGSVYSRMTVLPLLIAAVWSRVWFDWRVALGLVAAVLVWTWLNPRLFPKPKHTDNWASKVTFGERVWIETGRRGVPARHRILPPALNIVSGLAVLPLIYALVVLDPLVTILAGALSFLSKLWFADRMVCLFEDVRSDEPRYEAWVR